MLLFVLVWAISVVVSASSNSPVVYYVSVWGSNVMWMMSRKVVPTYTINDEVLPSRCGSSLGVALVRTKILLILAQSFGIFSNFTFNA